MSDVAWLSAADLRAEYAAGRLSPVEATRCALEQIERLDGQVNAFVTVTAERACAAARAAERAYRDGGDVPALCGIPVSVKDVVPTAGIRTTMGSRLFADWVPGFDAPLVERLRAGGAVLLGKTTVPEFGWKGDSGNPVNGPARNPFDLARTAGGSSGGAAAAVATGMGPLAQGGDGAGSIRIPAALCGVVGLKPSHGRVPYAPAGALELLVSEGPIARTVADAALLLDALAGPDPRDRLSQASAAVPFVDACGRGLRSWRVAWSPDLGYARVDPGVARVAADAIAVLEALGADVERVDPGFGDPHDDLELLFATAYAGMDLDGYGPDYRGDRAEGRAQLGAGLRALVEQGERHTAAELAAAHLRRLRLCERVRVFMERYDLLVTPTLPTTAFAAGEDHPGCVAGAPTTTYSWLPFTVPFNLTGLPAITVPAGLADGLPVGLQLVGRWRDDHAVLAAAAAFEQARPWLPTLRDAAGGLLTAP